jgi:hypothetical protein
MLENSKSFGQVLICLEHGAPTCKPPEFHGEVGIHWPCTFPGGSPCQRHDDGVVDAFFMHPGESGQTGGLQTELVGQIFLVKSDDFGNVTYEEYGFVCPVLEDPFIPASYVFVLDPATVPCGLWRRWR